MEKLAQDGMTRRKFLGTAAALFGAAALAAGCGEETTGSGDGSMAGLVEPGGSDGHKHSVSISKEQIASGAAVTLTLSGNGHTHTLDLTAEDVAKLGSKQGVHGKQSGLTGGHSHAVHFM